MVKSTSKTRMKEQKDKNNQERQQEESKLTFEERLVLGDALIKRFRKVLEKLSKR